MTSHRIMPGPVSDALYALVRDFLFDEAALLDGRRYSEWYALLTPDIEYRIAAPATRFADSEAKEILILDDRAADIAQRMKQISAPNLTYCENPSPVIRRFVSNIRVRGASVPDEFLVESYVLVCRSGGTLGQSFTFSAARRDTLRQRDGAFGLARRNALLDQAVLTAPNFATFL